MLLLPPDDELRVELLPLPYERVPPELELELELRDGEDEELREDDDEEELCDEDDE